MTTKCSLLLSSCNSVLLHHVGGLLIGEEYQGAELPCGFWTKLPTESPPPRCFHCVFETKPSICELPRWLWRLVYRERSESQSLSWGIGGRARSKWQLCGWKRCIWDDRANNLQHGTTRRCASPLARCGRRYLAQTRCTVPKLLLLLDLPLALLQLHILVPVENFQYCHLQLITTLNFFRHLTRPFIPKIIHVCSYFPFYSCPSSLFSVVWRPDHIMFSTVADFIYLLWWCCIMCRNESRQARGSSSKNSVITTHIKTDDDDDEQPPIQIHPCTEQTNLGLLFSPNLKRKSSICGLNKFFWNTNCLHSPSIHRSSWK